jgi:hypothetical protein
MIKTIKNFGSRQFGLPSPHLVTEPSAVALDAQVNSNRPGAT